MKSIIIGIGNTLLSDDGVGFAVLNELKERLASHSNIEFFGVQAGGLRLVEEMIGYDKAYIIDAMISGELEPGTIKVVDASAIEVAKYSYSTHDTSLLTALEMAKILNLKLPNEIKIFGVEAKDVHTFSESLTEAVAKAVPKVVEMILQEVNQGN